MSTDELGAGGQPEAPPDVQEPGSIAIHDGPVTRVADAHRSAIAPATHVLHEWHEYRVMCHGAVPSDRVEAGGAKLRGHGATGNAPSLVQATASPLT